MLNISYGFQEVSILDLADLIIVGVVEEKILVQSEKEDMESRDQILDHPTLKNKYKFFGEEEVVNIYQKPATLFERFIKLFVPVGGWCVEMCAGTSPLARQAMRMGRNCLAIDKNERMIRASHELLNKYINDRIKEKEREEKRIEKGASQVTETEALQETVEIQSTQQSTCEYCGFNEVSSAMTSCQICNKFICNYHLVPRAVTSGNDLFTCPDCAVCYPSSCGYQGPVSDFVICYKCKHCFCKASHLSAVTLSKDGDICTECLQ